MYFDLWLVATVFEAIDPLPTSNWDSPSGCAVVVVVATAAPASDRSHSAQWPR